MVGKKRVEVWLDYDDYVNLQRHSTLTISEQIRRAILLWFEKPEPTIEKLQKVIAEQQKIIFADGGTDDLIPSIPLPVGSDNEDRTTNGSN